MVIRTFGKDFTSDGGALTLNPSEVDASGGEHTGEHSRTHGDGWTISGVIHEDYYYWVNDFKASHPVLGKVWGDFQVEVRATSKAAYDDFYAKHKPMAWDYGDI